VANNAHQWEAVVAEGTVLTTELNSLANGSRTAKGTEFDNTPSGNNATHCQVELAWTPGSAPSAGGYVALYAIPALDGTNYADGDASNAPSATTWRCNIDVRAEAEAQVLASPVFPLGPHKYKFILENKTGVSFPASGSTLELFTMRQETE
jgi:hypothetical protein